MPEERKDGTSPEEPPEAPPTPEVVVSHIAEDRYVLLEENNTDAWIKTDDIMRPPR